MQTESLTWEGKKHNIRPPTNLTPLNEEGRLRLQPGSTCRMYDPPIFIIPPGHRAQKLHKAVLERPRLLLPFSR